MTRGLYRKLAAGNIRKNGKIYIPYVLTCIFTVTMYYMVLSLSKNPGLEKMLGAQTLMYLLQLGSLVIGGFSLVFLFYTNSFLMKRRKEELGLYFVLGMEKRHLFRVLGWETLYVGGVSLGVGLALGVALDKLMYLWIVRMLGGKVSLGFFFSGQVAKTTVQLFSGIFLLIYLLGIFQLQRAGGLELLQSRHRGEREPKSKWLMALLGVICLGGGYYLALTMENPLASLALFFPTVLLVLLGTYLLFTAGSILLLKMLRRNPKFYYHPRHFTGVSGMLYRMKRNGVGLANICILSTAVLIMISSTSAMMLGMEGILQKRYPQDFMFTFSRDVGEPKGQWTEEIRKLCVERGVQPEKEIQYDSLVFTALKEQDTFRVERETDILSSITVYNLFFVTLEDYNRLMGEERVLEKGEILLYSNRERFDEPILRVFDREYRVAGHLEHFFDEGQLSPDIASTQFIVLWDFQEMEELYQLQKAVYQEYASHISSYYGFDIQAGEEEQVALWRSVREELDQKGFPGSMETLREERPDFLGVYGGFFFIGIFLGGLFGVAMVLIIYYKQVTEGYEDQERFVVMQKVGMSWEEVRRSIHSQILMVFFLPVLVAGLHVAVAFPLISKLLLLFNLSDMGLQVRCTLVTFLIFVGLYVGVYGLTARAYYQIVRRPSVSRG
ncbi:MAG: ABC transporter permease [Lachnospiraceae bacterium]|nr:ABC transporter permease [Lachnospiraceae bacterium]